MKRLLPYSLLLIAAIVLGACGTSAARSEPEFYGGSAPAAEEPYYDVAPAATMMYATDGVAQEAAATGGNANAALVEYS